MSKLKATTVYDAYWKANSTGEGTGALVYLKSEADKVIAKLEEKLKNSRNARKYWRKEYLIEYKECRHNKYKRCLAMAYVEWLKQLIVGNHPESILFRRAFKRESKWKRLAEKFKEVK